MRVNRAYMRVYAGKQGNFSVDRFSPQRHRGHREKDLHKKNRPEGRLRDRDADGEILSQIRYVFFQVLVLARAVPETIRPYLQAGQGEDVEGFQLSDNLLSSHSPFFFQGFKVNPIPP